ncbi:hypothetical protein, partial [Lentzea indica]|uniref:hypothetical protein n=1 Tax=Lentzea indica TaxID=2604800 RepID=UPI001CB70AE4
MSISVPSYRVRAMRRAGSFSAPDNIFRHPCSAPSRSRRHSASDGSRAVGQSQHRPRQPDRALDRLAERQQTRDRLG